MKLFALLLSLLSVSANYALEPRVVPNGLGVNIHFTQPQDGELDMIRAAGFTLVRMDLFWHEIEKAKGVYDFSSYGQLVDGIEQHGMRIILILDYTNRLYDDDRSVFTEDGRAAYAKFAGAAATHFKGKPVLFEIYNEPNITPFWRPAPDAENYAKMALAACKAIRAADVKAIVIGPALAGATELDFLETCFKSGLLEYWSAVSIHPYRQTAPESVADDYRKIRALMHKYVPKDKQIPIVSGEWGFSDAWAGFDRDKQASYLARQILTNLANDIPISIYYDWRDDGLEETEAEHHFGAVEHMPTGDPKRPFKPKPAYLAARTLTDSLKSVTFNKRLIIEGSDACVLLFSRGTETILAACSQQERSRVPLPLSPGRFLCRHIDGREEGFESTSEYPAIVLTGSPVFIEAISDNPLLRTLAEWQSFPSGEIAWQKFMESPNGFPLKIRNHTDRPLNVIRGVIPSGMPGVTAIQWVTDSVFQPFATVRSPVRCSDRLTVFQQYTGLSRAYFEVELHPVSNEAVLARLLNSLPDAQHQIRVASMLRSPTVRSDDALLTNELTQRTLFSPFDDRHPPTETEVSLQIQRRGGDKITTFACGETRALRYRLLPLPDDLQASVEGDEKTPGTAKVTTDNKAPPLQGMKSPPFALDYTFGAGWKYACIRTSQNASLIPAIPSRIGMWIYGDNSKNLLRMRFVDSTGQTFQPDGGRLNFDGWKYVEFPMDGSTGGFWGGAKDGKIHYPIKLETLLLIDNASRAANEGKVYLAAPCLYYDPK